MDSLSRSPSESRDLSDDSMLHPDAHLDGSPEPFDSEDILKQDWSTTRCDSPYAEDVSQDTVNVNPDDVMNWEPLLSQETHYEPFTRQLRPQRSSKCGFQVPYLDLDETGDFDPREHERQNRQRRRRTENKERYQPREDNRTAIHDVNPESFPQATRLRFTSDNGRRKLRQILDIAKKPALSEVKGYALRRKQPLGSSNTPVAVADLSAELAGQPAARGCVSCFDLREHCSLLDDEASWPCAHCKEYGDDCQLVTLPKRFKACQSCKRRRTACSYTTTQNHSATCQQCAQSAEQCVAGPVKEFIRLRIRYEQASGQSGASAVSRKISDHRKKPPAQCLECLQESKGCVYKPDDDGVFRQGCTKCLEHNLPCKKVGGSQDVSHEDGGGNIEVSPPAGTVQVSPPAGTVEVSPPMPPPKPEESPQHKPPSRSIQQPDSGKSCPSRRTETSFTYPIVFNCDDPEIGTVSSACTFCAAPEAAIYGFGLRDVTIRDHPDGRQCHEVSSKRPATSLCIACTTTRMNIVACTKHDMRPIVGVYASGLSQDVFTHDTTPTEIQDLDVLCSLCPDRGVYECAAEHSGTERGEVGCGMKLCEHCALRLEDEYDGDLQGALATLPARMEGSEYLQLRADCELLRHGGALHRHLSWLGRQVS